MKVLIIDDNINNTEVVSFFLEANGIECNVITNGRNGLEAIQKEHYDLILLDLAMPDFSGIDIFDTLKEQNLIGSNNIVIFTASSIDESEIKRMLEEGARGIVYKPLSIDQLEDMLKKHLPGVQL
jgi:DNA-binding response OmpR family regulator